MMGNAIEPAVDVLPTTHESPHSTIPNDELSNQLASISVCNVAQPSPEEHMNTEDSHLIDDVGTQTLIREVRPFDAWMPFLSSVAPNIRSQAENKSNSDMNASTESPNTSLPLSESEIPETFDSSFDPTELSVFFANNVAIVSKIIDQGQTASLPLLPPQSDEIIQKSPSQHSSPSATGSLLSSPTCPSLTTESVDAPAGCSSASNVLIACNETLHAPSSGVLIYPAEDDFFPTSPRGVESVSSGFLTTPTKATLRQPLSQFTGSVYSVIGPQEIRNLTLLLPENVPLHVTTYADATNLAIQYPERANEILALPLSKPTSTIPECDTVLEADRSCSPSLHDPEKPNWAAAQSRDKLEISESLQVPQSRDSQGPESLCLEPLPRKPRRRRGRNRTKRSQTPPLNNDHNTTGCVSAPPDKHPHPRGAERNIGAGNPPELTPCQQHITSKSNTNDLDTPAQMYSEHQEIAQAHDAQPSPKPFECSDVGAHKRQILDAISSGMRKDATSSPTGAQHQAPPTTLGADRLGRHIIFPRTISNSHATYRRGFRVQKQPVADRNMTARRYLGDDTGQLNVITIRDPGSKGKVDAPTSTSIARNRRIDTPGPGETSAENFLQIGQIGEPITVHNQPRQGTYVKEEVSLTPRFDQSPFREILPEVINKDTVHYRSHTAHMDAHNANNVPSNTKSHVSPRLTSLRIQENHAPIDSTNGLHYSQHAADSGLPAASTRHNVAPSRIMQSLNHSGVFLPPKPLFVNSNHSNRSGRRTDHQHPFGLDPHINSTPAKCVGEPAFIGPSANSNGPVTYAQRRTYTAHGQPLPAQSEAFSRRYMYMYTNTGAEGLVERNMMRGARVQHDMQRRHHSGRKNQLGGSQAPFAGTRIGGGDA